jgi:hypothetical protein
MSPADAKADCEARKAKLECDLTLARLQREDQEAVAEKQRQREEQEERRAREKDERTARERTLREWHEEEVNRRTERLKRRQRFFSSLAGWWSKRLESLEGQSPTFGVLFALGVPAGLALLIYALTLAPPEPPATGPDTGEVLALGLLTAAAAFAVGGILGFLFGIPRSLAAAPAAPTTPATPSQTTTDDKSTAAEAAAAQHFGANTNLEQISDWLTKILVGVGLVQIHQVSGAIEDLAEGLAPGLGTQGFPVAVTLLIAFTIAGFVSAYLFTRLRLQGAFERALTIEQAVKKLADAETTAIAMVQRQLAPGTDNPSLDALTETLKAATPGTRTQAFFLARRQRMEKWGGEGSKAERGEFNGLSIPVFKALIACDTDKLYPRLHAELGYALLELDPPEFSAAKDALDDAIALRSADLISRTPLCEFNRAYCRIELDPQWKANQASPGPVIEAICSDLEAVIGLLEGVDKDKHKAVEDWLKRNAETADDPSHRQRAKALLDSFQKVTHT